MSQAGVLTDPGTALADIETLTPDSGGAIGPDGAGNVNILGGDGIETSGAGTTITITSTGGGFAWTEVTGTTQALSVSNGYVANNAALVTLTLPSTASIGDVIKVDGKGAGLFSIAQNASQTIHFLSSDTTTGVGSLTATNRYDCVTLRCITDDTDFVVEAVTGNLTIA